MAKSAIPEVPPGPEKSGFFQYDLVSFYRKMGFFGVFDKFEGSISGLDRKTGFLEVLDRKPGFGPKTGFLIKNGGAVLISENCMFAQAGKGGVFKCTSRFLTRTGFDKERRTS